MEFKTYTASHKKYRIDIIKKHLIEEIDSQIQLLHDNTREKLIKIREAVQLSGGCRLASRYGMDNDIVFADSELIEAFERENRCIEYLWYRYEFKDYPLHHRLRNFPLVVAVEASAKCNLRCRMCFQSNMDQQEQQQNRGIMSWEIYQKFLKELDNHKLYSVVFASRGEPLLNPNIDRMIAEAKKRGVLEVKLNTNATLLTEDMSRRLLNSGLDLLVFSVDSIEPENYKKIRGIDLGVVLENINRFLKIRKNEFPKSKIKVRVAMVLCKDVCDSFEKEIDKACDYWLSRVDELSVKTENNFSEIYDDNTTIEYLQTCNLLWERVYLWHDGRINPCDIDHLSTLCLGSICDGDTISEVWNGKKLEMLRSEHLTGRCSMSNVCSKCVGY